MINWNHKAVHKLELIDSCSYGELWLCELAAKVDWEEMYINLFGGKLLWFYLCKIQRHIEKTMRGLRIGLNPDSNGVIDSAQFLREYG